MNGLCDSYCRPCIYSRVDDQHGLVHCDYIGIIGHSRGCPAGEGCVMRVVGEKRQSVPFMIFKGKRQEMANKPEGGQETADKPEGGQESGKSESDS